MRVRCIALPLLLCLGATLHAQATVPGWTYAINITFDSGTGRSERGSIAMRYRTTANAMRQEMLQIGGTANRIASGVDIEGTYTLMNDRDSTFTTVMPSQHSAMIMVSPMLMLADRPKSSLDINSTTRSLEDLGAGDKILGHATHHYRYTTTGSITIKMGNEICTHSTDSETEVWVAPDVDIQSAMLSMAAHYTAAMPDVTTSGEGGASPIKGAPLRTKSRQSVVLPSGESRTIETTMEYVELSNAPLDASLFAIPADYHVMDMRKEMAGMLSKAAVAAATDSALRANKCPG